MRNTLIDAGPMIALFDRSDQYHLAILRFIEDFQGSLLTTWPVITEVSHILNFSIRSQMAFMEWISRGGVTIFGLQGENIERLIQLMKQFDDVPMDLADASLIVASEAQKCDQIVSIDSDFYIYRNIRNQYLRNIFKA